MKTRKQSGFTLVEIAIVLVIIGLLLGGVLKGQELITQAKIKNVINDLNGVSAAIYAYQDRYRALPGDEKSSIVSARWSGINGGDGNGIICGTYNGSAAVASGSGQTCASGSGNESTLLWQHLRSAGLVTGAGTSADIPQNAVGGFTGIQAGAFGMPGHVICTNNLPAKVASSIDAQMDDGAPATGTIRGEVQAGLNPAVSGSPTTAPGYVDDGSKLYVICKAI
ncbi:MAG: prepilin-type N-terminal cleavage/methylation domain-containing protein [Azovibrio sp.]|nr:prepilin-type N-terminal cleavage/methylation domain-containing protein [Azovibrio sp.]